MRQNTSNENRANKKFSDIVRILENDYALKKTMIERTCVDLNGNPIPWYTYPAIEYIKQLDFSDKTIFEFGSGNSSLFWASICKNIISVDEDEKWYKSRLMLKKDNMDILYKTEEDYFMSILSYEDKFDVIIVDGKDRDKCCESALKKIKSNGLIILDNTDWASSNNEISNAIKILKDANLIQVDFCGFGPINNYTWATSFFFTRDFDFKSKNHSLQPINIIGGICQH